jgi:hypothetical protein
MRAALECHRRRCRRFGAILSCLLLAVGAQADDWLQRVPLESGRGSLELGNPPIVAFLTCGGHSFAPDEIRAADGAAIDLAAVRKSSKAIALFQGLNAVVWRLPADWSGKTVEVTKRPQRDAFWDQILVVDRGKLGERPTLSLVETGEFAAALPADVRDQRHSAEAILRERESLVDPVIPQRVERGIGWSDLASAAYPLDFQKVLLASRNDASPAFAYQNGQWFTTWLSHDLPKWTKEDHWFAPALRVGDNLIRPTPLSASTSFATTDDGVTLPLWRLRWRFEDTTITQWLFSHRASADAEPATYVKFQLENPPAGARLALALGRRPNCHYWDEKSRARTPIPFFTLPPNYRQEKRLVVDADGKTILESAQDFRLEKSGPDEMLATFEPDEQGCIYLRTPQTAMKAAEAFDRQVHRRREEDFARDWTQQLRSGAQMRLPSREWMQRIDTWQSQVASITRVHYQGAERLSYGGGFYQYYFGPEEGWPIVALAKWGRGEEAKRQAEIMLSAENRDKSNVHHQSRNGTAAWYTAEVARLTGDREWLLRVAPALVGNAEWTIEARRSTLDSATPLTRGLLPAHIYGGDVRDPATSFYASLVCYKGLVETADVLRKFGTTELKERGEQYDLEARDFRKRLAEVMRQATVESSEPPFLPLALAVPSLDNKNEGPYDRLTDSRYGNYWNLFAPSVLELGVTLDSRGRPNSQLLETMAQHGGLWAALPRFNAGLDAAYSIGVLRELQRRSMRDVRYRHQAIAGLNAFFLHAASRNGYTIPEVAGLFPYRLDRTAYEQLVRESPWSFGMYDGERYLGGHISFTEPLGAAAGEALWLIRDALVSEGADENGLPNGELYLLANAPSEWFAEGKEIVLEKFPTAYGTISLRTRSEIDSRQKITLTYEFEPGPAAKCRKLNVRIAPEGHAPRDESFAVKDTGTLEFDYR